MKGTGGSYGFGAISGIGRAPGRGVKDLDPLAVRRLVEKLTNFLERMRVVFAATCKALWDRRRGIDQRP